MISYNPQITRDKLVFYVDASNKKSYPGTGTIWYDISGNGNNATLYNSPAWINNRFQFRSVSKAHARATVDFGILRNTAKDSEWQLETYFINVSQPISSESFLIGRTGCHGGLYLNNNGPNTDLQAAIKTGNCWTGAYLSSRPILQVVNSTHAVMTYNDGSVKYYLNGALHDSGTFDYITNNGMQNYSTTLNLGGNGDATNYYANIDMSFARAYKKELTAQEVIINYEHARNRS